MESPTITTRRCSTAGATGPGGAIGAHDVINPPLHELRTSTVVAAASTFDVRFTCVSTLHLVVPPLWSHSSRRRLVAFSTYSRARRSTRARPRTSRTWADDGTT